MKYQPVKKFKSDHKLTLYTTVSLVQYGELIPFLNIYGDIKIKNEQLFIISWIYL